MGEVHISLKAEKLFSLFGFSITNSILATWLVMAVLILVSFIVTSKLSLIPSRIQSIVEMMIGGIYDLFKTITGEKIKKFFPLVGTLFFFIIFLNWMGLIPGVGTIGIYEIVHEKKEFIPLLRAGSADINTTLAFAIVSVILIQYYGFSTLGKEYLGRFINLKNPINFFVGILEIMSEGTKIISFAFRLFGNIFAGEVLLTVVAFLMPLFAPLPFLALELFVGFIQALVFSMLTAVFLSVATTSHEH